MKEGIHDDRHSDRISGTFYHAHLHDPESPPQTKLIIDVLSTTPGGKKEAIVKLGNLTFRAATAHVVRHHDGEKRAWDIPLTLIIKPQLPQLR